MLDRCCPLMNRVKYILETLNVQIRLRSGLFVHVVSQCQLALQATGQRIGQSALYSCDATDD